MYCSWKRSVEGSTTTVSALASSPAFPPTLLIPEAVRSRCGDGGDRRRWRLPATLIRAPAAAATSDAPSAPSARRPDAADAETLRKLSSGFELLFRLLLPTTVDGSSGHQVLSRADLAASAARWSLGIGGGARFQRPLRRLLDDFWALLQSLLVAAPSAAGAQQVSVAAVLDGLRRRVRDRHDLMTLRRSLLGLAGDLFALLIVVADGVGASSDDGSATEWTARLLAALTTAGVDVVAVRTALVESSSSAVASAVASGGRRAGQFRELRRDSWLRMVHAQFF